MRIFSSVSTRTSRFFQKIQGLRTPEIIDPIESGWHVSTLSIGPALRKDKQGGDFRRIDQKNKLSVATGANLPGA
jgi:hypothetical protein